jgi:hypothetical protein
MRSWEKLVLVLLWEERGRHCCGRRRGRWREYSSAAMREGEGRWGEDFEALLTIRLIVE